MNSDQTAASIWLLPSVLLSVHLNLVILAEQKGRAPKTGQTNQCIDDPAEQRTLSTEEPGYQIELKKPHQSPVETTDDGQDQCDAIHTETSISIFG